CSSTCRPQASGSVPGVLASLGLILLVSLTAHCSSPQTKSFFQSQLYTDRASQWARANDSLLHSFWCQPASQLNRDQLSALVRRMTSQQVLLEAWQLSCLANLVGQHGLQDDFEQHPPDLLLFYDLTQVRGDNCQAFTHHASQGDTELLANLPDQRVALRCKALDCLGGPRPWLSASDLLLLGSMVCDMDVASIAAADPHILQNRQRCPRLTTAQQDVLNMLLASGRTVLGWAGAVGGTYLLRHPRSTLTQGSLPQGWDRVQPGFGLRRALLTSDFNLSPKPPSDPAVYGAQGLRVEPQLLGPTTPGPLIPGAACELTTLVGFSWGEGGAELKKGRQLWDWDASLGPHSLSSHVPGQGVDPQLSREVEGELRPGEQGPGQVSRRWRLLACSSVSFPRLAGALDISACPQSQKDVLYAKAREAFGGTRTTAAYYRFMRPYLGGAPVEELRHLAQANVSMDIDTFTNLNPLVLQSLSVDNVTTLLGQNVGDLQKVRSHPTISSWLRSLNHSALGELGLDTDVASTIDPALMTGGTPNTKPWPPLLAHPSGLPGDSAEAPTSGAPRTPLGALPLTLVLLSSLLWLLHWATPS
uniref:Mesothelin like n=1 Tax=Loxodonta africana TaxID=9785 RepID=G3U061_LOXAF